MNVQMNGPTLFLDRRQTLELIDAAGAVASVRMGCLWITMENDRRDIMLCAGDTWTVQRNGRTLVHAEQPSALRLTDALARPNWKERLRAGLREFTRWAEASGERRSAPYY